MPYDLDNMSNAEIAEELRQLAQRLSEARGGGEEAVVTANDIRLMMEAADVAGRYGPVIDAVQQWCAAVRGENGPSYKDVAAIQEAFESINATV
jgi:hypothetical protein